MYTNSNEAARSSALKPSRDQLNAFIIEAHICPHVTLRVLGLLTQHNVEYITVSIDHHKHGIVIQFTTEALKSSRLEKLRTKLEAVAMVQKVETTTGLNNASAPKHYSKVG